MEELQNKKRKNRLTLFLLVIFGILIWFLAYSLWQENKEKTEIIKEIEILKTETKENLYKERERVLEEIALNDKLDNLIEKHQNLLDDYDIQNEDLLKQDSVINQLKKEIEYLLDTKKDLQEAREKIEALKDISRRYVKNIDSLLRVNGALIFEKDSVVKVNQNINWKNYQLNKKNKKLAEKVSKGSVLDLQIKKDDIEIIYYRSTGKKKYTDRAKKVQKIRTNFTVAANQISDAEMKTVYMQIINENGELIQGNELQKTIVADSTVECTSAGDFEYNNIEMTHCLEWERVQVLLSGTYLVNLIIEGNIPAQTTLKLR